MSSEVKANPLISRGNKSSNFPGTLTFVGLRALDPLLQHAILAEGLGASLIASLGGSILNPGRASNTGITLLDSLNLSPYRLAILGMSVGAAAKHALWKAFIGEENMSIAQAGGVCMFNSAINSVNTLLFIAEATSSASGYGEGPEGPHWPGAPLIVGSALFATGILTELTCEFQRKAFKNNPENEGKPYMGGLFALARHINYGAYALWRSGYSIATGGWLWGGIVFAFFTQTFVRQGIPELDAYCELRYADLWHDYKGKTPYKLFPYIY